MTSDAITGLRLLLWENRNSCVSFAAISKGASLVQEYSLILIFLASLIGPV